MQRERERYIQTNTTTMKIKKKNIITHIHTNMQRERERYIQTNTTTMKIKKNIITHIHTNTLREIYIKIKGDCACVCVCE